MNCCSSGSSTFIYSVLSCQILKAGGERSLALAFRPCTTNHFLLKISANTTHPQSKYLNGLAARATSTPAPTSPSFFPDTETGDLLSTSMDINCDPTSAQSWSEFARNVSGEWDGFRADFTMEGKPIELPEVVVPEAFREWEVKVYDWQTQCPTLAEPAAPNIDDPDNRSSNGSGGHRLSFFYKSIKLLPTVGCEADAATRYSIIERNINVQDVKFAYQSTSGSYVAIWPVGNKSWELEHCLTSPEDPESRVRIIQTVCAAEELGPKTCGMTMVLDRITVFREQRYGPFRNGEQLGGCAIRDSAFASTPPTTASQLSGVWYQNMRAVSSFLHQSTNENVAELLAFDFNDDTTRCKSERSGLDVILLPKQLWCSLRQRNDEAGTRCEVGWILDNGQLLTSTCTFSSNANVEEMSIALETKGVSREHE